MADQDGKDLTIKVGDPSLIRQGWSGCGRRDGSSQSQRRLDECGANGDRFRVLAGGMTIQIPQPFLQSRTDFAFGSPTAGSQCQQLYVGGFGTQAEETLERWMRQGAPPRAPPHRS